jgi:hypothetical protein
MLKYNVIQSNSQRNVFNRISPTLWGKKREKGERKNDKGEFE